jgi:hypothetical protein
MTARPAEAAGFPGVRYYGRHHRGPAGGSRGVVPLGQHTPPLVGRGQNGHTRKFEAFARADELESM